MKGVSANIMCGQEGYFGTSSFNLLVNMNKMSEIKVEKEKEEEETDILKELDETDEFGECSTNNLKIDSMVSNLKGIKIGTSDDYELDFKKINLNKNIKIY